MRSSFRLAAGLATAATPQARAQGGGFARRGIGGLQLHLDETYPTKACPRLEPGAAPARLQAVKAQGYQPCAECKPPE